MSANFTKRRGPAVISYDGAACGAGYEHWIEEICRQLVKADAKPLRQGPVHYTMSMAALPQVRVAHFEGSSVQFVAKEADGAAARLFIQAPIHTPVCLMTKNRKLDLGPADIGLTDAAVVGAETIVKAEGRFRSIGIDRKALLAVCPHAEDFISVPLNVAPQLKTLVHHYHEFALRNASEFDSNAQWLMAQHLIDLVSLVLGTGRDETERATNRGLAAARLAAVKTDILVNLGQLDLSASSVAACHGITRRYVDMLFETEGVTFSEFVVGQRLSRAHHMLSDSRFVHRSINEVALDVGFGDLSYFNRCFRRQYGMTPSDVREQAKRERDG